MPLRIAPQAGPTVLQQRVASGQSFNGSLPLADPAPDRTNALWKYAAPGDSVMGLFLWAPSEPVTVTQFLVGLNGSANITLEMVNIDPATFDAASPSIIPGEALTLVQATNVPLLQLTEANFRLTLMPFQALRLITTASAAPQIAQATAYLTRAKML